MTYTHFDTVGRPTIVLKKRNVCDVHAVPFQVGIPVVLWRTHTRSLTHSLTHHRHHNTTMLDLV